VSMGGAIRVPFRVPTGTVLQGNDKIPLGSCLTAEAATRAYDGWAAATPGCAPGVSAGHERGSARAPRHSAALATRPGAHVQGLPHQRGDDDDDELEQLSDSGGSDGEDDDGGAPSIQWAGRGITQRKAPAAGTARGSEADCAR
jgi:hypothetical protein